jgi:hypothetical protein
MNDMSCWSIAFGLIGVIVTMLRMHHTNQQRLLQIQRVVDERLDSVEHAVRLLIIKTNRGEK